jgi:hypothetical protein
MKNNNLKKYILLLIKVIIVLAIIIQVLLSILNIFSQDGIANYEAMKKIIGSSNIQLGFKRTKIVQYNESNHLKKYFNPVYTILILTEDKLGGYVIRYDRGFSQELYIKDSTNVTSFTLDNLDFDKAYIEAKDKLFVNVNAITNSNSKIKYEGIPNTDSYRQIEGFDVIEQYFDGLKPNKNQSTTRGLKISDYKFLKVGLDDKSYLSSELRIDAIGGGVKGSKFASQPEVMTLLKDPEYTNAKFIALNFDKGIPSNGPLRGTSKLKDIRIIHKDRSIIEVPTKPDGSFDFESVKYKFR